MHMCYSFTIAIRKPQIALTMNSNTNPLKTRQKIVATKPTRPTQNIAVLRHLVAKSWIICRSRSWRWVREQLDTSSYALFFLSPQASPFPRSSKQMHGSRVSTICHTVHSSHILSVKLLLVGDEDKNQTSARSSIHVPVSY